MVVGICQSTAASAFFLQMIFGDGHLGDTVDEQAAIASLHTDSRLLRFYGTPWQKPGRPRVMHCTFTKEHQDSTQICTQCGYITQLR